MRFQYLLFLCLLMMMVDTAKIRTVYVQRKEMKNAEKETSMTLFILQQITQLSSKLDKMKDTNHQLAINNLKTSQKIDSVEKEIVKVRQTVVKNGNQLVSEMNDIKNRVTAIEVKVEKLHQKSCESSWVLYDGHCYVYGNSLKTWSDAENDCRQQNSHLVKVDGALENKWISQQMKVKGWDKLWMGASDTEKEGEFKWVKDGSELEYSNWLPGQPDNYDKGEDCLSMWNGDQWNDAPCNQKKTYLCEKAWNK